MWKKDDIPSPAPVASKPEEKRRRPIAQKPPSNSGELATIGRSITIKGEVTGDEDILIQGRVDGSVNLKQQSVTVGPEGRVKADITGRTVIVEGEVEGNLKAQDQVILRATAAVQGDITASRLVLEDGAVFRGGVDMGEPEGQSHRSDGSKGTQAKTPSGSVKAESGSETKPTGTGKEGSGSAQEVDP